MAQGSHLERLRLSNKFLVLETIRLESPVTRADLARLLNLSSQTVSNLVEELMAEAVVRESGLRSLPRGQPARELILNPGGAYSAGFHLDRGSYTFLVSDLEGTAVDRRTFFWGESEPSSVVLAQAAQDWKILGKGLGPSPRFRGLGIACPGPLDPQGAFHHPVHFDSWHGINLKTHFTALTGGRTWIENDARAAAVGELRFGWGLREDHFIYLYYGKGLGLGIIQHRSLVKGKAGLAGEVGHTGSPAGGPLCDCGRRGCWEARVSLVALQQKMRALGAVDFHLSDLEAWAQGSDPRFKTCWTSLIYELVPLLETSAALLDIPVLVVGGSLGKGGKSFMERELGELLPQLTVVRGELEDAGALGAAALPFYDQG